MQLVKEIAVEFVRALELECEDNMTIAKMVDKYTPSPQAQERSGDRIWRTVPIYAATTNTFNNPTFQTYGNLSVPMDCNLPIVSPIIIDAKDYRDPSVISSTVRACAEKVLADVNVALTNEIIRRSTVFVRRPNASGTFNDIAQADTAFNILGVSPINRVLVLNSADYNGMANDLSIAPRTFGNSKSDTAYEKARINSNIAGFDAFKAQYTNNIQAATVVGLRINGANQFYVPTPTILGSNGNRLNVDNRNQVINMASTSGQPAPGDAFTIAGVFSVHRVSKVVQPQLKTFRVMSVPSWTGTSGTVEISPPLISGGGASGIELQYRNISATPAANAACTMLNTQLAPANIFFKKEAINLFAGTFVMESMDKGMEVIRYTGDSGIKYTITIQGKIELPGVYVRVDTAIGANVIDPEQSGILLFGQT